MQITISQQKFVYIIVDVRKGEHRVTEIRADVNNDFHNIDSRLT